MRCRDERFAVESLRPVDGFVHRHVRHVHHIPPQEAPQHHQALVELFRQENLRFLSMQYPAGRTCKQASSQESENIGRVKKDHRDLRALKIRSGGKYTSYNRPPSAEAHLAIEHCSGSNVAVPNINFVSSLCCKIRQVSPGYITSADDTKPNAGGSERKTAVMLQ